MSCPVSYPSQMPTDTDKWLAYEQAMFVIHGISHVSMIMDVYECPIASTDIAYKNDKGQFVIKFLIVLAPTDEIIHLSAWAGSLTNQVILQSSSFGRKLLDPTNPLNLPQNVRFRGSDNYATPTCLADGEWGIGFPFLLVCPRSQHINYCRLTVERFFGRFTAINRFLLNYVPMENHHDIIDMIWAAMGIWNFRVLMDRDRAHIHTVVCTHFCERYYDRSRLVIAPMRSAHDNRDVIMLHHGIVPRAHTVPLFENTGGHDDRITREELDRFVLVEQEMHHPFGMVPHNDYVDQEFMDQAEHYVVPIDNLN